MASVATAVQPNNPLSRPTSNTASPELATKSAAPSKDSDTTKSDNKTSNTSKSNKTDTSKAASTTATTKTETNEDTKPTTNAPLAPPPKPTQGGTSTQNGANGGQDYFGSSHNNTHFSLEPNPFEQSFGQPSTETPGRFGGLPSVQSLTSPAPLGPGATPDWQNSLRSGPLSPAMLTGPTPSNGDYFDSTFRQSFPTPNESSLRSTGLTPGGASMFPAPSPNSQAIFNSLQSGGATPGTLDFHRSAMNAAARSKTEQAQQQAQAAAQGINKSDYKPAQQQQTMAQNTYGTSNNSESDAVNSLFMLANNGQRSATQFTMSQQGGANAGARGAAAPTANVKQDSSPTSNHRRGPNQQSIGGMSGSTGMSENGGDYGSDGSAGQKTGATGKRGAAGKRGGKAATANGRRKADEAAMKGGPPSKKAKGNSGAAAAAMEDMDGMDDDDDDDSLPDDGQDSGMVGGKKLTDEEKRKNFLERNRVAALKCRQRKKQWLANLQAKVEIFTTENDALTNQCAQLREENQNLKALLIQHKDCAVSHSQGLGGARMAQVLGAEFDQPPAHYGMPMGQQGPMMMAQGHAAPMQR